MRTTRLHAPCRGGIFDWCAVVERGGKGCILVPTSVRALKESEEADYSLFWVVAGAIVGTVFFASIGVALSFRFNKGGVLGMPMVWMAGFLTLRLGDLLTDWALYAISLHHELIERAYEHQHCYSVYRTGACASTDAAGKQQAADAAERLRTASLVFSILGTLLFLVDTGLLVAKQLGKATRRDVAGFLSVAPCLGICVFLFEDIPQVRRWHWPAPCAQARQP